MEIPFKRHHERNTFPLFQYFGEGVHEILKFVEFSNLSISGSFFSDTTPGNIRSDFPSYQLLLCQDFANLLNLQLKYSSVYIYVLIK